MDQAWLESLSEDWISQSRSSGSPPPSLPSLTSSALDSRVMSSRIPSYENPKTLWKPTRNLSRHLAERSPSENNIRSSQRPPRRLSKLRRSFSASSSQPAAYETIQHNKSVSVSPHKGLKDTPEWKRRLLDGDVTYGEQRDLFAPAGLESIFCPPQAQIPSTTNSPGRALEEVSVYMPSSPPQYNLQYQDQDSGAEKLQEDAPQEDRNRQQTGAKTYKLADVDAVESEFSAHDLSRSSSFRPGVQRNEAENVSSDPSSKFESSALPNGGLMFGAVRMVSGQSDKRNEELSPIYISRHNTVNGGVDYAALDLPPEELRAQLEKLRVNCSLENPGDPGCLSSGSLGDMTAQTEDFAHLGTFVNVRRGGRSHEGSFQNRLLSPSSVPPADESSLLPEESMQASTPKQLPNIKKTRPSNEPPNAREDQISAAVLRTPRLSPEKPGEKVDKSSSRSPLKLFGTYDTFTNQKLLRRLGQFEENYDDNGHDMQSTSGQQFTLSEVSEAFVSASSSEKVSKVALVQENRSRNFSSFGEGELDGYRFSEEISNDSNKSRFENKDKEIVSLSVLDPSQQTRLKFQLEPSPALQEGVLMERRTKHTNTKSKTEQVISIRTIQARTACLEDVSALPGSQRIEDLETPRKSNRDSEGKRLPKSPWKDPTPKRRRTLHGTEFDGTMSGSKDLERFSLKDTHQQMQSVIGRKRKDAKHGDNQQYANAEVLAMRQILRPRTPTPSQRSSQQNERPPLLEIDIASEQTRIQQEKLAKIQAELDAAGPLRSSTASGVGQKLLDDSRKGSVTTQDFLDEAKKIMAGIRGKARPRSGLTSVEESESEIDRSKPVTQDNQFDASCQESTREPFSRPPSREGGARIPRLPLKQEDPVLLNHLRKYQEMSGIDGIIGSSVKSIAAAREAVESAKEIERMTEETISRASGRVSNREDAAESDPPHIHISENPEMQRKRKHSGSSVRTNGEDHPELEFPSHGSNASSGQSTTRSIPTGSSRNSDSRRVIAPHTVSHLIPEQVAGMIFDRGNNIWVKQKSVNGSDGSHYFFLSDESEDDPFGDIPDLSVDETQELKRIKEIAAKRKEDEHPARIGHSSTHVESIGDRQQATQDPSKESVGALIKELEPLEPSKLTYSTSYGGAAAANNTSVISCDEILAPIANQSPLQEGSQILGHRHYSTESEIRKKDMEEAEREISINEGRLPRSPRRRRRNVTISFSSPIASVIEPSLYEITGNFDDVAGEASPSDDDDVEEDFGDDNVVVSKRGGRSSPKAKPMKRRTAFRSTSSLLSVGIHRFSARPVSRIDECEEESSKGDNSGRKQHISVIVSTPISSTQISRVVAATSRPMREIGTLSLTPMSEFTEHHADETFGLEVSYIGQGQTCVSGSSVKSTLSLSIKELVEKLTEVEPYEPRWGNMKQIQMNSKGLTNLHKLDEFCEQIENLDVSSNQISQLNGVPKTLRNLRIAHNYLSDLTAWGHLRNLQYIDVSNNELETLSAFCPLVHLRELRADNNKIKSLDGIGNLDGLLSLRMRGNLVESLDFAGTKLWRLTDLDLRDNRIHDVKNIHYLRCLSSLDLENNELSNFSPDVSEQLCSLKYLKLSGNGLQAIDVSQYPNLRLLYLDQNRLATVTGILKTKHLDSLSLRQQRLGAVINPKTLDEAFEVRKLFLSGNLLDSFRPRNDFLNLQYLELANCGCESIPMDFGQMFPNIRVLNLNFNALKDIKPLLGIVRLKKLHLAGNRLSRLRKTTNVLAKLATLTLVDLRSNPLTQGFYSQVRESRLVKQSAEIDESDRPEPFTLDRMDNEKDMKYSACLDMDTRMLRRVYEMLVIGGCTRLRVLDGLTVDRSISSTNDKVWEALLNAGILEVLPFTPKAGDKAAGPEKENQEKTRDSALEPEKSSIWQAEDSFA